MQSKKDARKFGRFVLLSSLLVTSCATTPLSSSPPPEVVQEAVIPRLSSELRKQPEPTGAYYSRVTQWRKVWRETLKTLQDKYAD